MLAGGGSSRSTWKKSLHKILVWEAENTIKTLENRKSPYVTSVTYFFSFFEREEFQNRKNYYIMYYYTLFSLEEWCSRALTEMERNFSLCYLVQVYELFLNKIPDYSLQAPAYNTAFPKQTEISNTFIRKWGCNILNNPHPFIKTLYFYPGWLPDCNLHHNLMLYHS